MNPGKGRRPNRLCPGPGQIGGYMRLPRFEDWPLDLVRKSIVRGTYNQIQSIKRHHSLSLLPQRIELLIYLRTCWRSAFRLGRFEAKSDLGSLAGMAGFRARRGHGRITISESLKGLIERKEA